MKPSETRAYKKMEEMEGQLGRIPARVYVTTEERDEFRQAVKDNAKRRGLPKPPPGPYDNCEFVVQDD